MAISLEDLSRKLPIGVQSFEDLRTNNCLYVDKTDYVYFLANSGTKSYFLARPRRFGKSLFANTLRAYFEGKKECFKKLKIDSLEKDWIQYPIAYFAEICRRVYPFCVYHRCYQVCQDIDF